MTPLCTAGYQGRTADDLVQLLTQSGIEVVVDVRERPLSRKRGLSKRALSDRLACEGVEYVHIRELGNPKSFRDALKGGWAFDEFAAEFKSLLETQTAALAVLGDVAASKRTCLLCFEADPGSCHRSLVAEVLAESLEGIEVVHLGHDC
jgi:uncharacterized protein (DUF488 family)